MVTSEPYRPPYDSLAPTLVMDRPMLRPALDSLVPTHMIQLSPQFVAQVRELARRKRGRSKAWVVVAFVLVALGAVAAIPASRTVIVTHAKQATTFLAHAASGAAAALHR